MTQYHASVEIIFLGNNMLYIDGLVQDCSISIANMLKILQYCTKPSIFEITEATFLENIQFVLRFIMNIVLSYCLSQ